MVEIPLTQDKVALIDDEDYERVSQYRWHAKYDRGRWYAMRLIGKYRQRLHRFILGFEDPRPEGDVGQIDHRNGDGLDNQRKNLRVTDQAHNSRNRTASRAGTSGYKGVTRSSSGDGWQAQIKADYHNHYLGIYKTKEEAARVYDAKALELHGEFARLNFPS